MNHYMLSSRNDANHNALGLNVNMGSHNIEVVRNPKDLRFIRERSYLYKLGLFNSIRNSSDFQEKCHFECHSQTKQHRGSLEMGK
uniref:Uncharacterized protein n=1 Tax=Megaselia scalaris TaxID=36166 RepID=T1H045_MEGSC